MIQLLRNKLTAKISTMIFACILAVSPLLSEAFADSTQSKEKTYVASSEYIPSDEIKFDGKGKLDAINPVGGVSPKETQNSLGSAIVIIDGLQMQFTSDIKIYDDFSQPLSADALLPGAYIGFNKDPSDLISELWLLKPEAMVSTLQPPESPPEKKTLPSDGNPVLNINGVWKN
jgi:hypothetical protein